MLMPGDYNATKLVTIVHLNQLQHVSNENDPPNLVRFDA